MAKSRLTFKKRRIVITKSQEDKGDLQISSREARIRLTPKFFFALILVVTACISIYMLVSQYAAHHRPAAVPVSEAQSSVTGERVPAPAPNSPPRMMNAAIIPQAPNATMPLDVKYEAVDQDGDPISYSFRWFVNDAQVQEGTSSSLQPGPYRAGDAVYAEVTPADASSTGKAMRTDPVTIAASPPTVNGVTLTPEKPFIGDILTAAAADTGRSGSPAYSYQWYVNGDPAGVPGSQNTFDTRNLKKRDSVSVAVTASEGALRSGSVRSNTVFLQNRNPEILSSAPDSLQGGSYSYQVVAKDPDGDTLKYRLERAPAGMTINETSGLIQWSLPKNTMFAGRNEAAVRVTVDDGEGGTASQDFTIVFTDLFVQ